MMRFFFSFLPNSPMQYIGKLASTKLWFNIPLIAMAGGMCVLLTIHHENMPI